MHQELKNLSILWFFYLGNEFKERGFKTEKNDKLYEKSTPIHIRAAILYNYLIEKNKLNLKKAVDNGRIYYVHMLLPNIINENVMGF